MNNAWAFLPMEASNDLLGDPAALRNRLAEQSYLYFSRVLDPAGIQAVRDDVVQVLGECGWIKGGSKLDKAVSIIEPVREGDDEFFRAYDAIQGLESFHTMAHDETLTELMRTVLGPTAFPHPLKIARLSFPDHFEVSTLPHQDFPNNQGTPNLTATWLPLGDVPIDLGGLAVLRGSSAYGVLALTTSLGPGNRQAVLPPELLANHRWVTTDYAAGDVLVFPSMTVHASLHNVSARRMGLSIDFRFQLEGGALTEGCLRPHFERLDWDDIYGGWESTRYQHYWRELDFETVDFVDLDLDLEDGAQERIAREVFIYETRRHLRFARAGNGEKTRP